MAIGVIHEVPGGTQEQYDAVLSDPSMGDQPPGAIFHVAGPMEGGWRVVEVWESQEDADRFFRERLQPVLERVGVPPVKRKVFPVHNMMP